jgi:hypothetical protein
MSLNYYYIDGINNISLLDGVVRMDMVTLSKGTEQSPQIVTSGHLCMSTRALLRTYQQLGEVIESMQQQGVIKKKPNLESSEDHELQSDEATSKTAAKKSKN